jgi:serine/threonine-protein kinase HipA
MREATILFKGEKAGILTQHDDASFTFTYSDDWVLNIKKPSISLTLQKKNKVFHSPFLFPFLYNMLPEGTNKQAICKLNKIDLNDYFGLLLTVATEDTIGAITIEKRY